MILTLNWFLLLLGFTKPKKFVDQLSFAPPRQYLVFKHWLLQPVRESRSVLGKFFSLFFRSAGLMDTLFYVLALYTTLSGLYTLWMMVAPSKLPVALNIPLWMAVILTISGVVSLAATIIGGLSTVIWKKTTYSKGKHIPLDFHQTPEAVFDRIAEIDKKVKKQNGTTAYTYRRTKLDPILSVRVIIDGRAEIFTVAVWDLFSDELLCE